MNKTMNPSSKSSPSILSTADVENLANDPRNLVYTYVHDEPTALFTSQQQIQMIQTIQCQYGDLRRNFPEATDDELRAKILATHSKNNQLKLFVDNNPKIWMLCTNRDTTSDELNHIRYMLYLRTMQEQGKINEAEAQQLIQTYLLEKFKTGMSLAEYKASKSK